MNIVHIATTNTGGAGIAAWRQHEALRTIGINSRFLCARAGAESTANSCTTCPPLVPPLWKRGLRRLLKVHDPVAKDEADTVLEIQKSGGAAEFELFSSPHARFAPESHPWVTDADLVHLHWTTGFVDYPRFFARITKPLVWTLHDQNPYLGGFHYTLDREHNPALHKLDDRWRTLKRKRLQSVSPLAIIGNSTWNTTAAQASGFFAAETRFETIFYPLDANRFAPRDKTAAKLAFGLPVDHLIIGFASTSLRNKRKGLVDLLASIREIERSVPVALLSFGSGPTDTVKNSVSSPWIHLGYLENDDLKCAAYSAMDCFVIPSHAEAFGQTAIEALACGTPVIGSDVGGIREALDEGRAGLLFPVGDVGLLSKSLRRLTRDEELRRALIESGRRLVIARHAPSINANRYRGVYESLMHKKS